MQIITRRARLDILIAAMLLSLLAPTPAAAQQPTEAHPVSLVISYRSTAANRPAFRRYLVADLAPRLRSLQKAGDIAGFQILFSWYRQPDVWDALAILQFPSLEALAHWNAIERTDPGGLDAAGLKLSDPVASYITDLDWHADTTPPHAGEVYYVIPYQYRDAAEYRRYAGGYVIPQADGWLKSGVLDGYGLYMNRFPTGAPWDSLFVLRYRDVAAFDRRAEVMDKVRAALQGNAEWKSWSENKAGIRTESENSIAELIAN